MSAPNEHDSQSGLSPLQIIFLVLAGFFALIAIAIGFIFPKPAADDGGAADRIAAVAKVEVAAAGAGNAGKRSGQELFTAACSACHGSGVMGAPKAHDKAAWSARLGGNVKSLVASARKGKGGMPPSGGVADATDEELAKAIEFMKN